MKLCCSIKTLSWATVIPRLLVVPAGDDGGAQLLDFSRRAVLLCFYLGLADGCFPVRLKRTATNRFLWSELPPFFLLAWVTLPLALPTAFRTTTSVSMCKLCEYLQSPQVGLLIVFVSM